MVGDLATIASGRVTSAVLSLATALITTRMLGPKGYGTVAIVGIAAMLIFSVSSAWTGVAVRRYGREDLERYRHLSRLTWARATIAAPLFVMCAVVAVALKLAGVLSAVLTWPLLGIALATGLLTIVVDHWSCVLETSGRMKISAAGQVLSQVAYVVALLVILVLGRRASALTVLILALGSLAVLAVGAAPFVWRLGLTRTAIDRQLLRRVLRLSLPMVAFMVGQYIFGSVDLIALRAYRTQREVGIYAVAYQTYTVLSAAAVTATSVLVPLFVSLSRAGRRPVILRYFSSALPAAVLAIAVAAGLAVLPVPFLVPIVFGHQFAAAATPVVVLIAGLGLLFASYLAAPVLTLHEDTRATASITVVAALINIGLDILFLGALGGGVTAPAVATDVALTFVLIAFYARARRLLGVAQWLDPVLFAPLAGAMIPTLLVGGALGVVVGLALIGGATAAILRWRCPLSASDVDIIEQLDMPQGLKRIAVKMSQAG